MNHNDIMSPSHGHRHDDHPSSTPLPHLPNLTPANVEPPGQTLELGQGVEEAQLLVELEKLPEFDCVAGRWYMSNYKIRIRINNKKSDL